MNDREFNQRVTKRLAEERGPLRWWYLSYADEKGFRGVVVIEAHGFTEACLLSARRHLSPGGEVVGVDLLGAPEDKMPPMTHRNRLLSRADLESIFGDMVTLSEIEARDEDHKA